MKNGTGSCFWSRLAAVCVVALTEAGQAGTIDVPESSARTAFWLGGDEAVAAFARKVFVLGPVTPPGPTPIDPEPRPETVVWDVGEDATAFVQDGVLYVRGTGVVASAPWSAVAGEVEKVKIGAGIAAMPEGALAGMDNLMEVNGLSLSVFSGVAAGVVKGGGFTAIAVDSATKTGTVAFRVKRANAVDAPESEWTAVDASGVTVDAEDATAICVPISADAPAGFFKVVAE